jgi:hypothetical protein
MRQSGPVARRLCLAVVSVALLLTVGCGQSPALQSGPEPTSIDTTTIAVEPTTTKAPGTSSATLPVAASSPTPSTSSAVPNGQTFEAVVLGPAGEPLASADIAPELFRSEPSVRKVLETALPAGVAAQQGRYVYRGTHLILVLRVAGAAESATGIEVYGDVWEQWFALAGWQPVQDTGGIYPVRIRLARDGDVFRFEGVDKPKDGAGYVPSLNEMMPGWVRDQVGVPWAYLYHETGPHAGKIRSLVMRRSKALALLALT